MSEWNDQRLDALVQAHLSSELDGQAGRAEAHFLRHVAAHRPAGPPAPEERPVDPASRRTNGRTRHVNRFRGWTLTFAGTALAASIATFAAAPALFREPPAGVSIPGRTERPPAVAQSGPDDGFYRTEEHPLMQYVHSRTWDEGTVVLEGARPARRVRHQWLERTHYFDPREGVFKEITVPREDIRYIVMDTY